MGAPPHADRASESDREPGTRPDGEAMPPDALDPEPTGVDAEDPSLNKRGTWY